LDYKNIKAVIFDFDGVFTNNLVIVSEDGKESVICNRSDGIGLEMLRKLNMPMMIVSSEINPIVKFRAKKLRLPVVHGVKNKLEEIIKFCESNKFSLDDIAFVGNDINDAESMRKVGFPVAVADAVYSIKKISLIILEKNGGTGAVREFCELIYNSHKND